MQIAQFSVIPYTLVIFIPIFLYHCFRTSSIGAAPLIITLALLNPKAFLSLLFIIVETIGIFKKRSNFF